MNKRIEWLESLIPEGVDIDEKYFDRFAKYARYMGNGVYQYHGMYSTDTRELFLITSLLQEGIDVSVADRLEEAINEILDN
jgi:hypothetical protein